MLPVPALSVGKDLTVQGANKGFEKLAGCEPTGKQAWSLFRTRRGNPLTRARLRDMIAKARGSIPVQIISPSGYARPASLHLGADINEGQTWIVTPADPAAGSLDGSSRRSSRARQWLWLSQAPGGSSKRRTMNSAVFSAKLRTKVLLGPRRNPELAPADTWITTFEDRGGFRSGLAASGPVELQAVLKGSLNRRVRIVVFPAANDNSLVVTAVETGTAPVIDEKAVQGQKLQAVGELAGGIAHDFNNLLTAIIGFSDLLLRRFRASDPAFKDLMNIKNNATRAAELVKQILAYSRRQTLRPAILRVTDVIEEFQATMGRTLGEKVKAKVQHGRDLWFKPTRANSSRLS